jgi:Ca2+-binding EF-hand superfamily protein
MKVETYGNNNTCNSVPMTTWSTSELQNLRDAFELLDPEKNGEILVEELRNTLEELTLENDNTIGRNIECLLVSLRSFESDAKLTWSGFICLLTSPNPIYSKDDVEKNFDLFDIDEKGYINMEDLRSVANDLGELSVSDAEIHEMIQRASSTGRVTLDQFREIMNNNFAL